jgi:hypothetical protein
MRKDYLEINDDFFEVVWSADGLRIEINEVNWRVVSQ